MFCYLSVSLSLWLSVIIRKWIVRSFRHGPCNSHLQSPELGDAFHASVVRIPWVGAASKVIAHLVAVVRADRNGYLSALLDFKQGFHDTVHVHVPLKMPGLVKIAVIVTLGASQMHETHPVPELEHHPCKVVVRTYPERPGTQAEAVGYIRHSIHKLSEIIRCGKYARKAEDRIRRISSPPRTGT